LKPSSKVILKIYFLFNSKLNGRKLKVKTKTSKNGHKTKTVLRTISLQATDFWKNWPWCGAEEQTADHILASCTTLQMGHLAWQLSIMTLQFGLKQLHSENTSEKFGTDAKQRSKRPITY